MRIVYVWDADYPWDVRTEKVCGALTQAGHDVHIVARNKSWRPLTERVAEGTVHRQPPWRWAGAALDRWLSFPAFVNPRWIVHIRSQVAALRPDVVIVRDLPLCPTAIWVARAAGVPVVLDMAENYPAMIQAIWTAGRQGAADVLVRNPRFVAAVERWCLPRLDGILVVVEESGQRLEQLGVPRDRITVVSNTPTRARAERAARHRVRTAVEPLELVYLGLMEIPRGVGDLIAAVAQLAKSGAAVRLRLIGEGRDRHLFEDQARRLGLGPNTVEFLGYVENRRALELVAQADIGVIPHHADEAWNTTIPNKLFDYMAAGLAVVTSDAVPAARIVTETGAGRVFHSGDPADLVVQVLVLKEEAVRERCAAAAREAILQRYHWERDAAALRGALARVAPETAPYLPPATPHGSRTTSPSTSSHGPQ